MAGATFLNSVAANPVAYMNFPSENEPIMIPPTIVVHSPVQNSTFYSPEVWLNFTITKPIEWFAFNVSADDYGK